MLCAYYLYSTKMCSVQVPFAWCAFCTLCLSSKKYGTRSEQSTFYRVSEYECTKCWYNSRCLLCNKYEPNTCTSSYTGLALNPENHLHAWWSSVVWQTISQTITFLTSQRIRRIVEKSVFHNWCNSNLKSRW